jgi:hypothetical protein
MKQLCAKREGEHLVGGEAEGCQLSKKTTQPAGEMWVVCCSVLCGAQGKNVSCHCLLSANATGMLAALYRYWLMVLLLKTPWGEGTKLFFNLFISVYG